MVAHWAHNSEIDGSIPSSATKRQEVGLHNLFLCVVYLPPTTLVTKSINMKTVIIIDNKDNNLIKLVPESDFERVALFTLFGIEDASSLIKIETNLDQYHQKYLHEQSGYKEIKAINLLVTEIKGKDKTKSINADLLEALKRAYDFISPINVKFDGRDTTEGQHMLAQMRSTLKEFEAESNDK